VHPGSVKTITHPDLNHHKKDRSHKKRNMKTLVAISICCLCIIQTIQAQTGSPEKRKGCQTWISTYESDRPINGVLYETQDSSVTVSTRSISRPGSPGKVNMTKLDVRSIDVIKIRQNGNVGQGVLYGAISGLVVGGAMGILYASSVKKSDAGGNDFEKSLNSTLSSAAIAVTSVLIGIGCIGTGIGVGAIIGSVKVSIPIHGSQEQFNLNKSMLNDYSAKTIAGLESKTFSKLTAYVADIDGNVYPTLALGGQVWMAKDLKVLHYRDGSEIPGVAVNASGSGQQYNWGIVNDSRKLCPYGWHVPFPSEWTSLFNSLGGENGAAGKLDEDFSDNRGESQWWSAAEQDADNAQSMYSNKMTMAVFVKGTAKTSELSVRCIRDN
jgi:hypothetical protein